MKLDAAPDTALLAAFGKEAVDLLRTGNIGALATRFGYAFSYDREPASAIEEDLRRCFRDVGATAFAPTARQWRPNVKFFAPNASIVAVVECTAFTDNGVLLLIELVVTSDGADTYITLEDISVPGFERR